MSVNIKTATGLKKLSGENITKDKVSTALGYVPAKEDEFGAHKSDSSVHVTTAEKAAFSDYNQLKNLPNIVDDKSGEFVVTDKANNIALKVDATGVTHTAGLTVNGKDIESLISETDGELSTHASNTVKHITAEERSFWNDKSYHSLTNRPSIVDDGSGEFVIVDNNNNYAFQVDASGTTNTANLTVAGKNVIDEINSKAPATHVNDNVKHITSEERSYWNDKSYNSLTDRPNIVDDKSGEFVVTDNSNQIALRVNSAGTTEVAELLVDNVNVGSKLVEIEGTLTTHKNDTDIHITSNERATWNNKIGSPNVELGDKKTFIIADKNDQIALKVEEDGTVNVNSLVVDKTNILTRISDAKSAVEGSLSTHVNNKENPHAVTKEQVGLGKVEDLTPLEMPVSTAQQEAIDSVQDYAEGVQEYAEGVEGTLQTHDANSVKHITQEERTKWNDKTWNSITEKPSIEQDVENKQFNVVDKDGQIALQVDDKGIVRVKELVINNEDTTTKIEGVQSSLSTEIKNVNDKVVTLIGDDSAKSVRTIANEELCAQLLTGKAQADFNTLEQMATWIEDHPEDVAAMNLEIDGIDGKIETHIATITGNPHKVTKSEVGLGNVDNTSDKDKELSDKAKAESARLSGLIDNVSGELGNHKNNTVNHVTQADKDNWNNKSYKSLTDTPTIYDYDELVAEGEEKNQEFNITDKDGNIALKVDKDGTVLTKNLQIGSTNVLDEFSNQSVRITKIENGDTVTSKAKHAEEADHAKTADNATSAGDAEKLKTAIKVKLQGDVSSDEVSFDGSGNLTLTTTVEPNSHDHTVTASGSGDDAITLEGTSGTNGVSYSVAHATYGGRTADAEYSLVTVDKFGHVKSGSKPTKLSELGISLEESGVATVGSVTNLNTRVDNIVNGPTVVTKATNATNAEKAGQLSKSITLNLTEGATGTATFNGSETDAVDLKVTLNNVIDTDTFNDLSLKVDKIADGTDPVKKAESATKAETLTTPVTISLSGDATGTSAPIDGDEGTVTIDVTVDPDKHSHTITPSITAGAEIDVTSSAGTNGFTLKIDHEEKCSISTDTYYTKVKVNKYGHVIEGDIPTTLEGYGIQNGVTSTKFEELEATVAEKQDKITGAAVTVVKANLDANKVVVSTNTGKVSVSSITTEQLERLSGVTDNVQTQINNRPTSSEVVEMINRVAFPEGGATAEGVANDLTTHKGAENPHGISLSTFGVNASSTELNILDGATITTDELNTLSGISTETTLKNQLDAKSDSGHPHSAADITSGTLDKERLPAITEEMLPSISPSKLSGPVPVPNGGTGATDGKTAVTNLGFNPGLDAINKALTGFTKDSASIIDQLAQKSDVGHTHDLIDHSHPVADITGVLPIAKGGTEATTAEGALINLGFSASLTASVINNALSGFKDSSTPIQDQLDGKASVTHSHNFGDIGGTLPAHSHLLSDITDVTVSATEVNYLSGLKSNVQAQLDQTSKNIDDLIGSLSGSGEETADAAAVLASLNLHKSDYNNPHQVTIEQLFSQAGVTATPAKLNTMICSPDMELGDKTSFVIVDDSDRIAFRVSNQGETTVTEVTDLIVHNFVYAADLAFVTSPTDAEIDALLKIS